MIPKSDSTRFHHSKSSPIITYQLILLCHSFILDFGTKLLHHLFSFFVIYVWGRFRMKTIWFPQPTYYDTQRLWLWFLALAWPLVRVFSKTDCQTFLPLITCNNSQRSTNDSLNLLGIGKQLILVPLHAILIAVCLSFIKIALYNNQKLTLEMQIWLFSTACVESFHCFYLIPWIIWLIILDEYLDPSSKVRLWSVKQFLYLHWRMLIKPWELGYWDTTTINIYHTQLL